MSIFSDNGINEDYLVWLGVNFLLEGLDAIERQREWTEREGELAAVLAEIGCRFMEKIYPESPRRAPMALDNVPMDDLWAQASSIMSGQFDPLDLIHHRDEEHPRGACRLCSAI